VNARAAAAPAATGRYIVDFTAGDAVFSEGDLGTEMFIIQTGQVEILRRIGDEDRQVAVLERGDFFGEMALLEELPRTATARALTDARLLRINGSTFDQMLQDNPEIAVRMMRKLSRRLRETDRLLQEALGAAGIGEMPAPAELPPSALPAEALATSERLLHEASGMEFPLNVGAETMVGRRDPVTGIFPDIDLSPVDPQRAVSRRHAKLIRRGEQFYASEEIGTMNGTFVNQARLEKGVPTEFRPGDELRFGVVSLRFLAG
jgi:CRP-like cAMP-binding protein